MRGRTAQPQAGSDGPDIEPAAFTTTATSSISAPNNKPIHRLTSTASAPIISTTILSTTTSSIAITPSKTDNSPARGGGASSSPATGSTGLSSPKTVMSAAVAGRPTTGRSGSSGPTTRSGKGPASNLTPINTSGGPGRTPQTRRKELSLQQQQQQQQHGGGEGVSRYSTSPCGSPRTPNAPRTVGGSNPVQSKKSRRQNDSETSTPTRKTSTTSRTNRKPSNQTAAGSGSSRASPPSHIDTDSHERLSKIVSRDKTKFDDLWDCKTIEHGLVRIPTQRLEELICKEDISKVYEIDEKPVACGLFATVRRCTHRETGVMYAAKFSSRIRCGVDCSMEILHEIAMLSACADSNRIVHLKDVFQNKHEIILVLEYAPGGDFQSVLDEDMVPFEEDVQGFLRQILEALDFIHERNIAHLDIKPQNIVLMGQFPNCEIKLCDLEVARVIHDAEDIREIIGTPDYVAPEILTLEPISLAADIWSLGVVAYVLLTGFSPFGGDTDQETLRNITTAELDFPDELFEGVSEEAKSFVATCLNRDPKKRPTVKECLQHAWLAEDTEPPSPSPLMLKIPTPDPISEPIHHSGPGHHGNHSSSSHLSATGGNGGYGGGGFGSGFGGGIGSRRSCQTCRDKITERKRYLSKSREAIFEKVANSNLKKSLSKSRERLCDMRLTLSKSRDHINETKTAAVRSQDKYYGFKCLSKSQEVLSSSLGGAMKRMVNGAVSDITSAFLSAGGVGGAALGDRSDTMDLVFMIPGGSVLLSNPMELLRVNSASLQILPSSIAEAAARNTPTSILGGANSGDKENTALSPAILATIEPLIEVSEEEEDPQRTTNKNSDNESSINNNNNGDNIIAAIIEDKGRFDKIMPQQNLSRSASVDSIGRRLADEDQLPRSSFGATSEANNLDKLASLAVTSPVTHIGVQVDLCKSVSSPSLRRRLADKADLYSDPENLIIQTVTYRNKKEPRRRGFSHDLTMGEETQNYAWRQELDKIRSQKPLRVSELIGTFNRREPLTANNNNNESEAAVKQRRRASLQIQFDPSTTSMSSSTVSTSVPSSANAEAELVRLKAQRRKSTSSLLSSTIENLKIQEQIEDIMNAQNSTIPPPVSINPEPETEATCSTNDQMSGTPPLVKKGSYLDMVAQRKKNWDYFEINHPKAISDQRLQQLKAKYQKRKTEELMETSQVSIAEENEDESGNNNSSSNSNISNINNVNNNSKNIHPENNAAPKTTPTPSTTLALSSTRGTSRSQSVPLFNLDSGKNKMALPLSPVGGNLDLTVDPFTGIYMSPRSKENTPPEETVTLRKSASTSTPPTTVTPEGESQRQSRTSRRRSSHLADIQEQSSIPEEKVLEVRIDPLTSQVETIEVSRSFSGNNKQLRASSEVIGVKKDTEKRRRLSVEIMPPAMYKNHSLDDDGFGSLPHTPTEFILSSAPCSNAASSSSSSSTSSTGMMSQNTRFDDGIFTSSEEVLDVDHHMQHTPRPASAVGSSGSSGRVRQAKTSATSLDGDSTDRSSVISWSEEIRPSSAQANPISRMCTGAFSRALGRLGDQQQQQQPSSPEADLVRRQSSPVFRLSTS